jgi:hypothetical protein
VPGAPNGPARLTQVIARAAGLTGADVIMGKATFADASALAGCSGETPECFGLLAGSVHVDQVVIGSVEPSGDGTGVMISLKVFEDGSIEEKSLSFPTTDIEELVKRLAREAPGLFVAGATGTTPPPETEPKPAPEPDPEPARQPDPEPPVDRDDGFSFGRVGALPWVVTVAGVAAAGVGTGLLYMGRSRQDEVDSAPISSVDDFERLRELEDEGDRYLKIGSGVAIGGGVLFVAGVILVISGGMSDSDESERSSLSLAPMPVDGGLGFAVTVNTP